MKSLIDMYTHVDTIHTVPLNILSSVFTLSYTVDIPVLFSHQINNSVLSFISQVSVAVL